MKALSLLAIILLVFSACEYERNGLFDDAKLAAEEPEGITDLYVASVTLSSINLAWDPVDGAMGYKLYRDVQSNFSTMTKVYDGLSLAYSDTTVAGGTTYYYKLGVVQSTGEEEFSNTIDARTGSLPLAPGYLNADPGLNHVVLSWPAVPGATTYYIYKEGAAIGSTAGNTYDDGGLPQGTSYSYWVTAANSYGEGPASPTKNVTTGVLPGSTSFEFVTTAGISEISIKWFPASNASSYKLYRDSEPVPIYEGSSLVYSDTGLAPGTTYHYFVRGVNNYGDGPDSTQYMATTGELPGMTSFEYATPMSTTEISLKWNSIANADTYKVFRDGTKIYDGSSLVCSDVGLSPGETYYYVVRGVNTFGEGPDSSPPYPGTTQLDAFGSLGHSLIVGQQGGMSTGQIPYNMFLVGDIYLYQTKGGFLGKFQVLSVTYNDFSIRWYTYDASGMNPLSQGDSPLITLTSGFNLETGAIDSISGDFLWQEIAAMAYLVPFNGAKFKKYP